MKIIFDDIVPLFATITSAISMVISSRHWA